MGYVYISYSIKDRQIAEAIKQLLNDQHIETRMSPEISFGNREAQRIRNDIRNCACFVLLLSNASLSPIWGSLAFIDVKQAIMDHKPILAIRWEELSMNLAVNRLLHSTQILYIPKMEAGLPEVQQMIHMVQRYTNDTNSIPSDNKSGTTKLPNAIAEERSASAAPYRGDKPFIFLSYAHKDTDRVMPVLRAMQQDGFRIWFDEGIDPGTEWDQNIAEHIKKCGFFMAFLSANYLESDNCKDELNYARDLQKQRVLIYMENVSLPSGMAMRLNRLQAIHQYSYSTQEAFLMKLYEADHIQQFRD